MDTLVIRRFHRSWGMFLLVVAAYFVSGELGLMFAEVHPSATTVWAPTGIAIAANVLGGKRMLPAVFLGALFVNIGVQYSLITAMAIATGNTLEGLVGGWLVRRYTGWPQTFDTVRNVLCFSACTVFIAPLVSATVGIVALLVEGSADLFIAGDIWFTWWVGDVVGAMVISPILLVWFRPSSLQTASHNSNKAEIALLMVCTIVFGLITLADVHPGPRDLPIGYLSILMVIWGAVRFGTRMALIVSMLLGIISVTAAVYGLGPFVENAATDSLALLQLFLGVSTFTGLLLAAAIEERYGAEDENRLNQERFRGIFNASKDGITFKSFEGYFLDVNDAFTRLTGYSRLELLSGMRFQDLSSPEFLDLELEKMEELRRTAKPVEFEKEYIRKDGTGVPVLLTMFLVKRRDDKPIGIAAIAKDITQRKREEVVKTKFVSLASHQLRTPLSTIRWALNILQSDARDRFSREEQDTFDAAATATRVMAETIESLLLLSEIEAGRLQPQWEDVNIEDALSDSLDDTPIGQLQATHPRVSYEYEPGLRVHTDRRLLRQILSNLIDNAKKYSPPDTQVHVKAYREHQHVRIEVRDEGIGIPAKDRERIFTLFFRSENALSSKLGGTGLGLYLAHCLVRLLRGTITFQSVEGQGTTFTLTLPHPGF